jgi:hypothetical protein
MFEIYVPINKGFFVHLQGLLYSFKFLLDIPVQIIVIDMGLTPRQANTLNTMFKFLPSLTVIKSKTYNKKELDDYVFKIDVYERMLNSNSNYCMYLDSKCHLKMSLSSIIKQLDDCSILINKTGVKEADYTSHKTLDYLNVSKEDRESLMYQATGFVIKKDEKGKQILEEFVNKGRDMMVLSPPDSKKLFDGSPNCHRQDQSMVSLVIKKLGGNKDVPFYSWHNTIFPS